MSVYQRIATLIFYSHRIRYLKDWFHVSLQKTEFNFFSRSKRKRSNDGIPVHASQQPASKKSKRTTSDPITMTDDDIKDMLEMSENRVIYQRVMKRKPLEERESVLLFSYVLFAVK